jgi:thymidylate synthase
MQRIVVFQEHGSGEEKIRGIIAHGRDLHIARVVSVDAVMPPVIEDPAEYLPSDIRADLVLDFFRHPDLSLELAILCRGRGIPVVASGKKHRIAGVFTPPT